jgi:ABC-type microcin C transport system permease subunit YejB
MSKKYYFDIPYTKKYETIWYGYLEFDKIKDNFHDESILEKIKYFVN